MSSGQQGVEFQTPPKPLILHASCVAVDAAGVLFLGASGRGKSGLALQIMALGASLVSDDRTCLSVGNGPAGPQLIADAPETLRGLIEARGVGILNAMPSGPCAVTLVVDLDQMEEHRLPPLRSTVLLGIRLPLVHMIDNPAFPAAILQYLKAGRSA